MIQFDRLLRLADFLDVLPAKRFDFGSWVGTSWGDTQDLSCGTTACALGWAATMPEFRALGLRLARAWCEDPCVAVGAVLDTDDAASISLNAAREVFGLTHDQANLLFIPGDADGDEETGRPNETASPREVAEHIRQFVAEQRTPQATHGGGTDRG